MKKLIVAIYLITSCCTLWAQKQFEGIITYDIMYAGESVSEQGKDYIPKQQSSYFKDGKIRMEMNTSAVDMIIVANNTGTEAAFLIDFMGMKMAINTTKDMISKTVTDKVYSNIRYTKNKKTIAGYKCKEVKLSYEGGEATIYTCDDLKTDGGNWLIHSDIKGAILEFSYKSKDDNVTLIANTVKETPLNAAFFEIPEGYMQIGQKDLESMFGGELPF